MVPVMDKNTKCLVASNLTIAFYASLAVPGVEGVRSQVLQRPRGIGTIPAIMEAYEQFWAALTDLESKPDAH